MSEDRRIRATEYEDDGPDLRPVPDAEPEPEEALIVLTLGALGIQIPIVAHIDEVDATLNGAPEGAFVRFEGTGGSEISVRREEISFYTIGVREKKQEESRLAVAERPRLVVPG